jgi:hypothetical protein
VSKVQTLELTFYGASKFNGTGLDKWVVSSLLTSLSSTVYRAAISTCNKLKIADAWASNAAFKSNYEYWTESHCVVLFAGLLSDAQFKLATEAWVANTATATTAWGLIGGWDVSSVKDFSSVFKDASEFTGEGLDSWNTTAVTTLNYTFYGASSMNANLGKWDVSKVQTLERTFNDASKFTGEGLDSWITTAVTTLYSTFDDASSMNANLGKWDVTKVTSLEWTFYLASKFTGGAWSRGTQPPSPLCTTPLTGRVR